MIPYLQVLVGTNKQQTSYSPLLCAKHVWGIETNQVTVHRNMCMGQVRSYRRQYLDKQTLFMARWRDWEGWNMDKEPQMAVPGQASLVDGQVERLGGMRRESSCYAQQLSSGQGGRQRLQLQMI